MPDQHGDIESKAAIRGHPLHPMLVPFPIAFLTAALLSDFGYWATQDGFWARASLWLVGAGTVCGAAAAVAGVTDFLGNRDIRAHRAAWWHFLGNAAVIVTAALNYVVRVGQDAADAVLPWGMTLSALTVIILVVTGWLGGELVFRHRMGVQHHEAHEHTS